MSGYAGMAPQYSGMMVAPYGGEARAGPFSTGAGMEMTAMNGNDTVNLLQDKYAKDAAGHMNAQYADTYARQRHEQLEAALETLHGGPTVFRMAIACWLFAIVASIYAICSVSLAPQVALFEKAFTLLA